MEPLPRGSGVEAEQVDFGQYVDQVSDWANAPKAELVDIPYSLGEDATGNSNAALPQDGVSLLKDMSMHAKRTVHESYWCLAKDSWLVW